jgi:polygalacturonase
MKLKAIFALVLLNFGLALAAVRAEATASFNVRDHGAKGDGVTLDHVAINRAIEAASSVGGGTVWVPAGRYLCGSIRLKSNIRLHLDTGSVIVAAPQSANAYDETEDFVPPAYQDGGHTYFRNSLIWGIGRDIGRQFHPRRHDGGQHGHGG